MALVRRAGPDNEVLVLFEESGRNVERAALLLRDLLVDYPERADLARELVLCEHEGDRIAHDIIHRLKGGDGRAAPMDPIDGPMEQASQMGDVLVGAGEQVARALRSLRTGADLAPYLVEIHRLENEGDRISRDGVASLFANGIDPMVVIRWKDIFASLEASVDACEHVAHVLEGISLRRRP
jgi:uncharacterized protein Yka (UPF0111/DUF47 family)